MKLKNNHPLVLSLELMNDARNTADRVRNSALKIARDTMIGQSVSYYFHTYGRRNGRIMDIVICEKNGLKVQILPEKAPNVAMHMNVVPIGNLLINFEG